MERAQCSQKIKQIRISSLHAAQRLTREMSEESRNKSFEKSEEKFGDKNTRRIFAVRSKKLQVLRNTDRCFLGKKTSKNSRKFLMI